MSGNNSDQEEKEMTGDDEKKPKENITDENETGNDVSETTDKKDDKDESDEESDESEVGLFDRPVEVSGVRERKQVQRLEMSFNKPAKETEISEGSGEKLGQCPRIESQISKNASSELKSLHRILYNRPGAIHEVKKNIRKFRGFPFSEGSAEYDKKKSALAKINLSELKHISTILDLEKTGTKEDIVNRVLLFLLKPKPSGKKVHEEKKKKSSKAGKKTRGKKKQVTAKKATGDSSDIIDSTSGSEAALSEDDCEENEKLDVSIIFQQSKKNLVKLGRKQGVRRNKSLQKRQLVILVT